RSSSALAVSTASARVAKYSSSIWSRAALWRSSCWCCLAHDLRHNYALRVTVDWMQGLTLFAPVHRYDVLIRRRKSERIIRVDCHSAIRMIEPPPCEWGLGLERTR